MVWQTVLGCLWMGPSDRPFGYQLVLNGMHNVAFFLKNYNLRIFLMILKLLGKNMGHCGPFRQER